MCEFPPGAVRGVVAGRFDRRFSSPIKTLLMISARQHSVLAHRSRQGSKKRGYLYDRMVEKTLKSDDAYVRYLAARDCDFGDETDERKKALKRQIKAQSSQA